MKVEIVLDINLLWFVLQIGQKIWLLFIDQVMRDWRESLFHIWIFTICSFNLIWTDRIDNRYCPYLSSQHVSSLVTTCCHLSTFPSSIVICFLEIFYMNCLMDIDFKSGVNYDSHPYWFLIWNYVNWVYIGF